MNKALTLMNGWRLLRTLAKGYAKDGTPSDLKITDHCVQRLKEVANSDEFLRILVDSGGCSGFEYKMSLDTKVTDDDIIFLVCSRFQKSLELLKGATVDYAEELMRASFRIVSNPIAEKGCSCGSSFAIKMD
ncbi:unnamed protein product [Gongylonema pulchrum]|uniref:Iron-sulfur cluster assembly 2 homolog, mitochondrial n=1 Tax=Gongylonema pulchrum TaxID=637853 RepID=A0A183DS80_9BILA|nr:unnamed protein product [Gongylonema pulchrum]